MGIGFGALQTCITLTSTVGVGSVSLICAVCNAVSLRTAAVPGWHRRCGPVQVAAREPIFLVPANCRHLQPAVLHRAGGRRPAQVQGPAYAAGRHRLAVIQQTSGFGDSHRCVGAASCDKKVRQQTAPDQQQRDFDCSWYGVALEKAAAVDRITAEECLDKADYEVEYMWH